MNSPGFRYALLFALGVSEVMPVALLASALPVLLRRGGASMEEMGALSLVMIPWAVKALWAPLVDRLGASSRFGRYRGWLMVSHLLLLALLVAGAQVDVPALLLTDRAAGVPALLLLSAVAATADVASHGLAVTLLAPAERGLGNSVQTVGMMLGMLLGGGVMLMLVDAFGWRLPLLIMAGVMAVPLVGVALHREAPVVNARAITVRAALALFRRPRIGRWLVVSGVLVLLPAVVSVPYQAMFVDHGMSLAELGLVLGVLSSLAGAAGGVAAGFGVELLGRARAFYGLHLILVVCLAVASLIVVQADVGRALLYVSAGALFFGQACSTTLLRIMMMDRSRGHLASSDYTLQISSVSLCSYLGAALGGLLAGHVGTGALFVGVAVLLLATLVGVLRGSTSADFSTMLADE